MACWRRPISPTRTRRRPRRWRRRPGSISTCPPASSRASSSWSAPLLDRGRPQAPPRPPAGQRHALGRRAQRARRRRPPHHRAAVRGGEEEGRGAPCRLPARQELAKAHVQAAGAFAGRLGPRRAEGPGPAPPEEGGGGLEDPVGGAGRRRARQAGRLVGGAAHQRLCGAEARQAQDGLRPGAQSRARSPSMPARTRRSWRDGWRCATSRTPSWHSAISRRWPRPPTGR